MCSALRVLLQRERSDIQTLRHIILLPWSLYTDPWDTSCLKTMILTEGAWGKLQTCFWIVQIPSSTLWMRGEDRAAFILAKCHQCCCSHHSTVSCPPLAHCGRITMPEVPAVFGNTSVWKAGDMPASLSEQKQLEIFQLQNVFALGCVDHCAVFLLLQIAKSPYHQHTCSEHSHSQWRGVPSQLGGKAPHSGVCHARNTGKNKACLCLLESLYHVCLLLALGLWVITVW